MRRYFLHLSDGKRTFTDSAGVDLTDAHAARRHARAQIRTMRADSPALHDWRGWKMIVADSTGNTLFEIGFDLKPIT